MITSEECIDFIENKLGCKLLAPQKELIRRMYEHNNYIIVSPRYHGRHIMLEHLRWLTELLLKEN